MKRRKKWQVLKVTLKDCTKEELMFIIKRLSFFDKARLERLLNDVEYERVKKKLAEADRWIQVEDSCRKRYFEIMKKYAGKDPADVPFSDIKEAIEALKDAEKAEKEYNKLMEEVEAYGNKACS